MSSTAELLWQQDTSHHELVTMDWLPRTWRKAIFRHMCVK